jgi:hypothetical protein
VRDFDKFKRFNVDQIYQQYQKSLEEPKEEPKEEVKESEESNQKSREESERDDDPDPDPEFTAFLDTLSLPDRCAPKTLERRIARAKRLKHPSDPRDPLRNILTPLEKTYLSARPFGYPPELEGYVFGLQ